jgi:hypothetical protein
MYYTLNDVIAGLKEGKSYIRRSGKGKSTVIDMVVSTSARTFEHSVIGHNGGGVCELPIENLNSKLWPTTHWELV